MPLQINQNCAVVLSFAPSPIVNAEAANWFVEGIRRWPHFHPPKNGVITARDREARQQPRSWQTSYDEANQPNDIGQTVSLASVRKSHLREPLNEDFASTARIAATETTGLETNSNGKALPGKILKLTAVMAVAGAGQFSTVRTTRPLAGPDFDSESIFIALNAFQQQDVGVIEAASHPAEGKAR